MLHLPHLFLHRRVVDAARVLPRQDTGGRLRSHRQQIVLQLLLAMLSARPLGRDREGTVDVTIPVPDVGTPAPRDADHCCC
jgi:hypothetical protein